MKKLLKYSLVLFLPLLSSMAAKSQLASDRPLTKVSPRNLKIGAPEKQPEAGTKLASEKKMPDIKAPKGIKTPQPVRHKRPEEKQLPSNSKKPIKDLARKPKVKN
jgi:hypothetical protein